MNSQSQSVEKAVALALAGATVIAGNTRGARFVRREAERKAWQTKTVCATPEVTTLETWTSRCWTECLLAGVVERALLKANVTAALWDEVVARSDAGRALMNQRATAALAREAWEVIHAYKLERGALWFNATAESRALHGWMNAFEERCRKGGWVDAPLAMEELTAKCGRIPKLPKQVVVFGFDGFTPAQRDLWRALEKSGATVTVLEVQGGDAARARVAACADRAEEFRTAARWARGKLEENPAARVGVLVPGLAGSRDAVQAAFAECLHPEQALLPGTGGRRAFEISLGAPLGEHPMVRAALRWLRLATGGLPFEEWSALLRSPYVGGGASEAQGRAKVDWELRKTLRAAVTVDALRGALRGECGTWAPKMARAVGDLQRAIGKLGERTSRSEWVVTLRGLLRMIDWPNGDELALTSEEFQVERAWEKLLADFGALDQVMAAGSGAELQRELERAANETTFEKENVGAPIQIAGPMAVACESFDAIWFCGLSDEAWPPRERANPLIPFALQKDAGVPGTSAEMNAQTAERVMHRVLQSAEECVLSWPRQEEDRELRPAAALAGLAAAKLDDLPERKDWDALQAGAVLEEYDDFQGPEIAAEEKLFTQGTRLLTWQSGCAFSAFAQARLGAEQPMDVALGTSKIDRGKITEIALQEVWDKLREWQTPEAIANVEFAKVIEDAVEKALTEAFPKGDEEWLKQHRAIERERLQRLMREWLTLETQRERFKAVQHQQPFEFEINGLKIHGKVDRVDQTMAGEFLVIDYKTGTTEYLASRWKLPRPKDPQLPIYALHQESLGRTVAGVAFAQVRTGDCEFNGEMLRIGIFAKTQNRKDYILPEARLAEWKKELEGLAGELRSGVAKVNPKVPPGTQGSTCRWCHLWSLCRVAELGVVAEEEEAEDAEDGE